MEVRGWQQNRSNLSENVEKVQTRITQGHRQRMHVKHKVKTGPGTQEQNREPRRHMGKQKRAY